jgi:hypothetical protein
MAPPVEQRNFTRCQTCLQNFSGTTRTALFAAVIGVPGGAPQVGRDVARKDDPCYRYRMVVLAKVPVWMSVAEFLNWDSGDGLKYELVDGEPRAMAPANRTQGILQGRLATLINNHLDRERRPCSLVVEPGVVPRLLPDHNVRVPDLAVACAPYQTEEAVLTDPVLLIEILSPSNQAKTGPMSGLTPAF